MKKIDTNYLLYPERPCLSKCNRGLHLMDPSQHTDPCRVLVCAGKAVDSSFMIQGQPINVSAESMSEVPPLSGGKPQLQVFVAASGAPKSWAFRVVDPDGQTYFHRCLAPQMTVPAMEIAAVTEALKTTPAGSEVIVAAHSDYVRLSGTALVTRGAEGYRKWFRRYRQGQNTNLDLWRALEQEVQQRSVKFVSATGADDQPCKWIAADLN